MQEMDLDKRGSRLPWLMGVGIIALVVAGLWPRPARVETAVVAEGPLRTFVREEGRTRIRYRYTLSAPVAGWLRRVPYKAGAIVESNSQVMAVLDPLPPSLLDSRTRSLAEARRDSAESHLKKTEAKHRFARIELERAERLYEARTVSSQELEQAQWRETLASREQAEAESALRQAEAELREYGAGSAGPVKPIEIRSPVSGKVLKVFEESSRALPAGTPLMEIGDPTDLEVLVEVLSRDGAAIVAGSAVELEQWGGVVPLKAVVRHVEPAAFTKVSALGVEEQRVHVVADIITPASERLGLGDQYRVEARIITWESAKVLKLPAGALFRRQESWNAFVRSKGRAELRNVTVGRSNGVEVEVLDGVKVGEEVILYPSDRVENGARVERVEIQ
ncbi:MAG: efflux RND transporter periplasmic adaptor subunit [Verrucomicrobia bacterium]|nr:efflux RND transporter periplasmic adaptor subunit [Verrucomicrobiota bacterium]